MSLPSLPHPATVSRVIEEARNVDWRFVRSELHAAISTTFSYWLALYETMFCGRTYSEMSFLRDDRWARVQVFSLSLIFRLWKRPHYRSKSFQQDMIDNLRNVAVPGTGVPLSIFCYSKWTVLFFIVFINPLICLLGAFNKARKINGSTLEAVISNTFRFYVSHLLHPQDWFSFWRLNCRLVSYHQLVTRAAGYKQEDKWTFLIDGRAAGVPVSPFMDCEALVCKNKNIEGGMGIFFYRNAAHGGDWIIQEKMHNAAWLSALLPPNAPLSTMRVITTSTWALSKNENPIKRSGPAVESSPEELYSPDGTMGSPDCDDGEVDGVVWTDSPPSAGLKACPMGVQSRVTDTIKTSAAAPLPADTARCAESTTSAFATERDTSKVLLPRQAADYITARSAVLRLGRAGAATDHSSILFDVDMATGVIKQGATNAHWYHLGPRTAVASCPWLPACPVERHPDAPYPQVTGNVVPDMEEALKIVTESHYKMMPDVPIVGWDVAFTPTGIFLLEVNLSCNFFRGTFDTNDYICFVDEFFRDIEKTEKRRATGGVVH